MILVTGSSGFVGKPLCKTLIAKGYQVRQITRNKALANGNDVVFIDSIGSQTDWTEALKGVDTVIHLAARAHMMNETSQNPIEVYREINTFGTTKLAQDALKQGIKRFIYISTIKVNGESTIVPFRESSTPNPTDPYGISKFEAEKLLKDLCKNTPMNLVILRPPLIYGPAAKGNVQRIISLIQKGIPLPFGCINNKRTMLYLNNLIDLLLHILGYQEKINDTFLVSDRESLSTKELVQELAAVLNPKQIIAPVPICILKALGRILGRSDEIQRLTENLEVDTTYLTQKLGWKPPYSPQQGLRETAEWYQKCTR